MRAVIAPLLKRLACRIAGHAPSELLAAMYGTEKPICNVCGQEVDA